MNTVWFSGSGADEWPEIESWTFATQEDANKAAAYLTKMAEKIMELEKRIKTLELSHWGESQR